MTTWESAGFVTELQGIKSSLLRSKVEKRNTVGRGMLKLIRLKEVDESGKPGDDVNSAVIETIRIFKYNRMSENKII
jgi:hypothetical protein